jgi:hypothetical protein
MEPRAAVGNNVLRQGTWDVGGVLVIDPSQPVTLNFSPFSGYATSGLAGHINFTLADATGGLGATPIRLGSERFAQPFGGAPAQPTPLTSYTIPADTFTQGRVYLAWLGYDTITSMDTTSVAGAAVGTLFSKETKFYIAAQISGTSTPPPVIVTPLAHATGVLGGSATFSTAITVGGTRVNYQNSSSTFPIPRSSFTARPR